MSIEIDLEDLDISSIPSKPKTQPKKQSNNNTWIIVLILLAFAGYYIYQNPPSGGLIPDIIKNKVNVEEQLEDSYVYLIHEGMLTTEEENDLMLLVDEWVKERNLAGKRIYDFDQDAASGLISIAKDRGINGSFVALFKDAGFYYIGEWPDTIEELEREVANGQ